MKKKLWIPILAAVLIVFVTAAAVLTQINTPPDDAATTPPHAGTLPPSTDGTTINDATLVALLQEAEAMINASSTVTLHNNSYVSFFLDCNDIVLHDGSSLKDERVTIVVNTENQPKNVVRYAVFLSLLTERYANCYTYADYDYQPTFNRLPGRDIFVYSEFKAAGYDTVLDQLKGFGDDGATRPRNAYYINYWSMRIRRCDAPGDIYPELLEQAF